MWNYGVYEYFCLGSVHTYIHTYIIYHSLLIMPHSKITKDAVIAEWINTRLA